MGGDERTILKNKVKAREKNHLTKKKPTLDIMSQDKIPILWDYKPNTITQHVGNHLIDQQLLEESKRTSTKQVTRNNAA